MMEDKLDWLKQGAAFKASAYLNVPKCSFGYQMKHGVTATAWVYLDDNSGKQTLIYRYAKTVRNTPVGESLLGIEDGYLCLYIGRQSVLKSSKKMQTGRWQHVAISLWGSAPGSGRVDQYWLNSIYIDGQLVGREKGRTGLGSIYESTLIGAAFDSKWNAKNGLRGIIGRLNLWNDSLDSVTIYADAQTPQVTTSNWMLGLFSDASGVFKDVSPAQRTIALEGGAVLVPAPENTHNRTRSTGEEVPAKALYIPDVRAEVNRRTPGKYRDDSGFHLGLYQYLGDQYNTPTSFGDGPFTMEAYFQAPARANGKYGGPIFMSDYYGPGALTTNYFGACILLAMMPDGSLQFGIANCPDNPAGFVAWTGYFFKSAKQITDGDWHHVAAVRTKKALLLYLDGELMEGEYAGNGLQGSNEVYIAKQVSIYCGSCGYGSSRESRFPIAPYSLPEFYGSLSEMRFWNRDLSAKEVLNGMGRTLSGHEPGLIGYENFVAEAQKEPIALPIKMEITTPNLLDDFHPEVRNSGPVLRSFELPFLMVQTRLMDDFSFAADQTVSEKERYCVVVTARQHNGAPLVNEPILIVAADPQSDIQIVGELENGKNNHNLTTDHAGQISFSVAAEALTCSLVKLQASFMEINEWIVVNPDRQAHHTLANLTGPMLRGESPIGIRTNSAPLSPALADASSDALAEAISHLMKTVVEHGVKTGDGNTRGRNHHDVLDQFADDPVAQPYENPYISSAAFISDNDICSCHLISGYSPNEEVDYFRSISARAMPNAHWGFIHQPGQIANFSKFPSEAAVHASLENIEIEALNPAAQFFHPPHHQRKRATRNEIAAYLRDSLEDESWLGRLSAAVTSAENVLVHTATHLEEGTAKVIKVVVVTAIVVERGKKKALAAVIQKVKHAAHVTGALLKKFGAEAGHVISYIKSVFNWTDILLSQKMIAHFLSQTPDLVESLLPAQRQRIDNFFDHIKKDIDDNFGLLRSHFAGQNMHNHRSKAGYENSGGVRHGYIHRLVSKHLTSPQTKLAHTGQITNRRPNGPVTPFTTKLKQKLGGSFSSLEQLEHQGVDQVVSTVNLVLDDAIEAMKAGMDLAFSPETINPVVTKVGELINADLTIPILSPLFSYITKQYGETEGEKLSMVNLISLAAAVPFTVFYKTFQEGYAPYVKQDLDAFSQLSWQQFSTYFSQRPSAPRNLPRSTESPPVPSAEAIASWSLGFVFSACLLAQIVVTTFNDTKETPVTRKIQIGLEIATQLTSVPFSAFNAEGHGPPALDLTIWFLQIPPLCFNFTNSLPLTPKTTVGWGVIHLGGFIGLGIWEMGQTNANLLDIVLKTMGNVFSTVPELDQVLEFDPDPAAHALRIIIDIAGLGIWDLTTVARLIKDMENNNVTVIR